jgi:hypothetical protein
MALDAKSFKDKIKHAFAVETDQPFSPEELAILDKLANAVIKRQMGTPAIMFLESIRPLNFIGSQAITFFQPVLTFIFSSKDVEMLEKILERRKSVGILIEMIEQKESECMIKHPKIEKKSNG